MKRLVIALCLCAPALLAQQEPTPFWMPPPPPKKTAPEKQKPAPPAKKKPPPESEAAPARRAPPAKKRVEDEPREEPAPPPAKRRVQEEPAPSPVKKRKREEPVVREPAVREPAAPREPAQREILQPEPEPEQPASRTRRPVAPAAPAPAPSEDPAAPLPAPARPPPEAPAAVVGETPGALVAEAPPAEPVPDEPRGPAPRFSVGLEIGLWGSPTADGGRLYDVAYGLRLGFELLPERLELQLLALRASRTAGSGFANASTAHDLFTLRAFYLLGTDRFTALLGGGAGVALAQTHYSVQDVGGTPVGLDATSGKLVLQVTAGGRARVYRGLDIRAEVSALVRDGQVNLLPLVSAGWAF